MGSRLLASQLRSVTCQTALLSAALVVATPTFAAVAPGATPGGALPRTAPVAPPLPEDGGPPFTIPPVFERPLGVEEGDRIFVRGFKLVGIQDDLAAGIRTEEVQARVQQRFEELNALVEDLRQVRQNRDKIDADGFTTEEKEKVFAFIQGILSSMSADNQVEAYERFIEGLRLQRLERDQGLTIGQLQLIADEVTKYYRERGYFLARAVVPAQEVVGGVVTIRVLEGRLGEVVAEGNRRYEYDEIEAPFREYKDRLITVERIEDALLTLQSYPGMSATGVFRPGKVVGTADILVNVQAEKPQALLVRADNHGSRFTGTQRLLVDYTWNAPLHDADFLNLQAVKTYDPANSVYGSIRYEAGLDDPDNRWGFSFGNNRFDVVNVTTGNNTGVSGTSVDAHAYYRRQLTRSRTSKMSFTAELARKVGETTNFGVVATRDEQASVGLQLDSEDINAKAAIISSWFLRVDQGFPGVLGVPTEDEILNPPLNTTTPPYSRTDATGRFFKFSYGYSALKSLAPTRSFLVRLSGQWTNDRLTSLEQFNMGGANGVRGVPTSGALRDYGALVSLEYQTRGLWLGDKPAWGGRNWNQVLGASVFYDYGVGLTNFSTSDTLDDSNRRLGIGGPGVSVDLQLPLGFSVKAQYAHLAGGPRGSASNTASIRDTNQLWIEIQRGF
jgi:hemolysin activation/secretion protein